MAPESDRQLGLVLGLVGGGLILIDGLLAGVDGTILLLIGNGHRALGLWEHSILLLLVGALIVFFTFLGRFRGADRSLASGAVLVVLVVAGWLVLGLTSGLLSLIGSLLALVAGVLFLVSAR